MKTTLLSVVLLLLLKGQTNAQKCNLSPEEVKIIAKTGEIRTPGNPLYPANQRCYWTLHGAPNQVLVLRVESLQTGPQSVQCNQDFITLPNGLRLCGNSVPGNCYTFSPRGMMEQGCDYMLPSCGCGMNVYSLDKWPPVIGFSSNGRYNFRGASINFTFIDCPINITAKNITLPNSSDENNKLAKSADQAWIAFRVAVIICVMFGSAAIILAFLLFHEKRRNHFPGKENLIPQASTTSKEPIVPPTGRRVPSARPPQAPPSVSSTDRSYANSSVSQQDINNYDYIQPVVHDTNHYEQPITHKSMYVDIH